MKGRKLLFIVAAVAVIAGLLAACGAPAAPSKVYELTFAVQHPITAPMMSVVNPGWYNWLDRESGGRIKITPLPSEQAAKAPDLYDAAADGVVDIACQMPAFQPGRWTLSEVMQLPFIFDFPGSRACAKTAWALFQKYPEIRDQLGDGKDVKVIGFHANGLAHVHTTKKDIRKMEDLKGLVLIALGSVGAKSMSALGATPESIMPGEMYDALAKGVTDGNALEWEGEFIWSLNELVHYSIQSGIFVSLFVHVMNMDTWNSLPRDLQKLFEGDNADRWGELHGYNFDKDDIMFRDMLDAQYKKEGGPGVIVLSPEERARWAKACEPIQEEWVKEAAKTVGEAKARAILEDAKKFAKQYAGYPDEACPKCAGTLKDWGAPGYE